MAVILDEETGHLTRVSLPIFKFEDDEQGNLVVYGKATDGAVDSDRQIVDPDWSGKALQDWLDTGGNVRVQHSPHLMPAGKGLSLELTEDGHWVKALVVEPTAQRLVKHGVLKDYSIGIARPVVERDITGKAPGGVIKGGTICEVSLVDRGANPNSGFKLVKAADDDSPWTIGDIDALLAQIEELPGVDDGITGDAAKAKKKPKKSPKKPAAATAADEDDPDDDDSPDADDGGSSSSQRVSASDDQMNNDPGDLDKNDAPDPLALKSEWRQARTPWLTREPSTKGCAGASEFLGKQAQWNRWHAEGIDAGWVDGGYDTWLAKRDFDPNVGGGTDRDQIPAADFIDPKKRRFPIVTPQDVKDAVSSFGRMGDPKIPYAEFKARLMRIARRKGSAFVQALPDTFKDPDKAPAGKEDEAVELAKGMKDCRCGSSFDADSKLRRCPDCGAKLKGGKSKTDKADTAGRRPLPASVKPVAEHREPDGHDVESFEADASLPTEPDPTADQVPVSVDDQPSASKGTATLERLTHDALCPVYHPKRYYKAYGVPFREAINPRPWHERVAAHAAKGEISEVARLVSVAMAADALASYKLETLADVRLDAHKDFTADYPTTKLTPSAPPQPGSFRRGYISTGHAPLSAEHGAPPVRVPPATHTPEAGDFDRGDLTADHQRPSPGDSPSNAPVQSTGTGAASAMYRDAAKTAATNAMRALHDHVANCYPNMCPLADTGAGISDMRTTSIPTPVANPARAAGKMAGQKASAPEAGAQTSDVALIIKAALADERALLRDQLAAALTQRDQAAARRERKAAKQFRQAQDTIKALRADVDEIASQPDPAQAPFRGAATAYTPRPPAPPAVTENPAEPDPAAIAKARREEEIRELNKQLISSNPARRNRAERLLDQYLTGHE